MIKTIVFTQAFRQHILGSRSSVPEPAPGPISSAPAPDPGLSVPKFKPVDSKWLSKVRPGEFSVPEINYEPVTRTITIHPDLNNEITDARLRLKEKMSGFQEVMNKEEKALNQANEMKEKLRENIEKQDVRQKNRNICRKEMEEYRECMKKEENCQWAFELLKHCRET
jgi:hypothetical protein